MQFKQRYQLWLQYILPHHAMSRLMRLLTESKWSVAKNWCIPKFIKKYNVDLSEAAIEDWKQYTSFNDFFTRALKSDARPIVNTPNSIACPVDGSISQIGRINDDRLFQAKGYEYNLLELLGGSETDAARFQGGHFATLYLSPRDYHRVHMPLSGTKQTMTHVPGKLFSVSSFTTNNVPRLFARNERVINIFETENGPMAVIFVGAFFVGSINIKDEGEITPPKRQKVYRQDYAETPRYERGQELGHFKLGSTVILLFGKDAITWGSELRENSTIKMGQEIGTIIL